ncbi:MAG TPA: class II aldolase/adducin family protein [Anaerolineales bacterium]|nr:class II aldolase/adducin family protein [Anaerolineales bacterium]
MIDFLIATGREIVQSGLVLGAGGNLSCRFGEAIRITASGAKLGALTPDDFVAVGDHAIPSRKPSSEWRLHTAVYAALPWANVVLHAHPPKAIALGALGRDLPALTPDFYLHLGPRVPLLPYLTPTTSELAEAVGQMIANQRAVLLGNHGVVVAGADAPSALLRLQLLEEAAAIWLAALPIGEPRPLSPDDCRALDEATGGRYKLA